MAGRVAQVGGWVADLSEGRVHWSDEVCRIHGVPPGTSVSIEEGIRYYAPEWRPMIREHFRKCVEEGEPYDLELEILTEAGDRTWVRSIGRPVIGEDGTVERVEGAFQDISPQKEAQVRVQRLETRLTRTLESISDAFFTLDREWRFTYVNAEAERVLERSREELLGRVVWDEFPAAVDRRFHEAYHRAMEHDVSVRFEEYYPPLECWFRVHAYPSEEGLAVYFQDVTSRRKAERALQESEERFRQLAEHIESVFWIAAPDGETLEYVSPAYTDIWGEPPDVLYEDSSRWLERVHPEDRERVERALARRPSGEYAVVYRVVDPDGEIRWMWDRAFPIRSEKGEVRRIVGVAEEITEQKELEEQLRQAQKIEAIGRLAGGVAHDFNNLLTVIQGHSQIVRDELATDSPLRQDIDRVLQGVRRAARLTEQLLAFSRRQVLKEEVLDLRRVVSELEPMLRRLIPERIELAFDVPHEAHPVEADPHRLQQVILNLAVNASDAIEGRGAVRFAVDTNVMSPSDAEERSWEIEPGSYARITVEDTGAGMTEDVRRQAFDPFFTTKPEGKGTGLGLSMVYGIVKQSRGHIMVETEPGRGTAFQVLLPLVENYPSEIDAPVAPEAGVQDEGRGQRGASVLLVEDDETVRSVARRILERDGYRVIGAGNGREALEIIQSGEHDIDVIVSDIIMPELGGAEFVDRLESVRPDLEVVLMSGYSEDELTPRVRERAREVLGKPFLPEELTSAVRKTLSSG